MDRYHRQILLPQVGNEGQRKLSHARVLLVGCGALGSVVAEQLVRAGIGSLRLCDRDVVELTNLQRQTLFSERDARDGLPKAVAAASRLGAINAHVALDARPVDVHAGNVESLVADCTLIIDGTDNVETRYLLNDVAVKHGIPWVYGACVGTGGRAMGIVPGKSPCLRCLFPDPPGPGELPTCDTAGVLAPAANVAASVEVVEAMKILIGDASAATALLAFDLWPMHVRTISTEGARRDECEACGQRRFAFLDSPAANATAVLCGRETVQVRPACNGSTIDLPAAAARLAKVGSVQQSDLFVRCELSAEGVSMTLFPDGRALVHGTKDPVAARSIYARYVGS
jgi:adenylyltransferase/sulfurtransferase